MEVYTWWTDPQKELADDIKNFVDNLMPEAEEATWEREFPREIVAEVTRRGYFGAGIDKQYGGMGLGVGGVAIVAEELSRVPGGLGSTVFGASMLGGFHQVSEFGTAEQKSRFLTKIAQGEMGAVGLTEPFVGTDAAGIATTARREGDNYIINGRKRFITGVGTASRYMLYAKTSDDPEDIRRNRHLTGFMVEKGMPGFTIEKVNALIAMDNMQNGHLNLIDVTVPAENRIGEEGQGWQIMMSGLNFERILCGALNVGFFREVLRSVVNYSQRRVQFGQPTIEMPTNQFKIADIIMELKLARLSTHYAAHLMDTGQPASVDASVCKLYGSDQLVQACLEAMQIMGGDGVTKFYPLERILREAKITQIAGGTSEAMRLLIFRRGLREISDDMKIPRRAINEKLGVPLSAAPPASRSSVDDTALLQVLADDYRVNPGLYMSLDDLKEHFSVSDEELAQALASLEEKKLVKLYRKRGAISLAKATYAGLNQANPPEYYRWFPEWVKDENIF